MGNYFADKYQSSQDSENYFAKKYSSQPVKETTSPASVGDTAADTGQHFAAHPEDIAAAAVEAPLAMVTGMPAFVAGSAGKAGALLQGKTSEQELQKASDAATPQWTKSIAYEPRNEGSKKILDLAGKVFNITGESLAIPGVSSVALLSSMYDGTGPEGYKQKARELYQQVAPVTKAAFEIGMVAQAGVHAYKGAMDAKAKMKELEAKKAAEEKSAPPTPPTEEGTPPTEQPPVPPVVPPVDSSSFVEKLKKDKEQKIKDAAEKAPLVEAALKNNETGEVERHGPKHDEKRKEDTKDTHTQGFVDENGVFLDRKQSWERALKSGQLKEGQKPERPSEGLHSGDLRAAGDERFKLPEETNVPKDTNTEEPVGPKTRAEHFKEIDDAEHQRAMYEEEVDRNYHTMSEKELVDANLEILAMGREIQKMRDKVPEAIVKDKENLTNDELHDVLAGHSNFGAALDTLVKGKYGNKSQQWLLNKLSKVDKVRDAVFRSDVNNRFLPEGKRWSGMYEPGPHAVTLFKAKHRESALTTFLHEGIHAATSALVREGKHESIKILNQIYTKAEAAFKADLLAKGWTEEKYAKAKEDGRLPTYGYTDLHEFLSEAFTNNEFQALLRDIPFDANLSKGSSLWKKFIDTLKEVFNVPKEHMSAFDQVIEHGGKVIESKREVAESKGTHAASAATAIEPLNTHWEKLAKNVISINRSLDQRTIVSMIKAVSEGKSDNQIIKEHTRTYKDSDSNLGREDSQQAHYENQMLFGVLYDIKNEMSRYNKGSHGAPAVPADEVVIKPAREVGSDKEMETIAAKILDEQGEAAAAKFYEDYQAYKKTWAEPIKETERLTGVNINNKNAITRIIGNTTRKMVELVKDKAERERLAYVIDKGEASTLSGASKVLADMFSAAMADIGQRALDKGVIKGLFENYVARNVVFEGNVPKNAKAEFLDALLGHSGKDPSMRGTSTTTKFAEPRRLKTREDLDKHIEDTNAFLAANGYDFHIKLKSNDIAEIYHEYATAVEKAIENKTLIDNLKQVRGPDGTSLIRPITPENPIPKGWEVMGGTELAGYAVHPDLMPALKFVFDAGPGDIVSALGNISQLTKRLNVIGSFFHAKSLMEVMSSAQIPLLTPLKEAIVLPLVEKGVKAVTGKDLQLSAISKAVEQFRQGGLGDNVDRWIKEGNLVLEMPEDVSQGILTMSGKVADELIGKWGPKTRVLEKSLSAVERLTLKQFDKYTWDYLHTGAKLMVADAYLAKAREASVRSGKPFDEVKARQEIGSFVNSSFGGLNWAEIARSSQTELGKRMANAAFSPAGRRGLQIMLFAPDWTVSTLKAFTSALPKNLNPTKWHPVEGVKGMKTPTTTADYARLYQMKTAITFLTVINAVNMMTAGRPIWDNKDPTRIEWKDGTSMQAMKHSAEPYHWLTDPDRTFSNKMGFIPRASVVAIAGVEYASPGAQKLVDPSSIGRAKAIASMALPFQVQAAASAPKGQALKRAIAGTAGFPILGSPPNERKAKRAERSKALKQQAAEYHKKAKKKGWE